MATGRALAFRLHVPVVSDPAVDFRVDGQRLELREGETWYVNVNLPHGVENGSPRPRVHLILDCTVNDWLRALFRDGEQFV